MFAKILQPTKSVMQSGTSKKEWLIDIIPEEDYLSIDDVAGWHSASDTTYQINLKFDSLEEAENYAKKHNIKYEIITPRTRKLIKKSYSENFR